MSCCYEVIPKPFQGEHICFNNSCSNQSIKKILSDSFYIYLAWILGKVSATKSKKKILHWIQNLSTLYQFWYKGPPIFGIGYTKTGIGWTGFGLPYTSSGNTLTDLLNLTTNKDIGAQKSVCLNFFSPDCLKIKIWGTTLVFYLTEHWKMHLYGPNLWL